MQALIAWAALDTRLRDRLRRRALARDERFAAELATQTPVPPGWTAARVAVTVIAVLVQLAALGALALGAWLVGYRFPGFTVLPGVVLLAFGALLVPRPAGLPRYATHLERAEAPHLHAYVAEIAAAAGTPRPHRIVVDDSFEADAGACGLLRRRYLRIGAPLFAALTPPQRVALVAHQLAHYTSGNPLRGGPAGSVDRSLAALVAVFEPRPDTAVRVWRDPAIVKALAATGGGGAMRGNVASVWYAELLLRPVIAVLRWSALGAQLLFLRLARRAVQQAEYRADAEAARVAGSEATRAMLTTLALGETVVTVLRRHVRAARTDEPDPPAWRALADGVRAHAPAEPPMPDPHAPGHPPLALRLRLLGARPAVAPALAATATTAAEVDADLAPAYRRLARDLRHG